MKKTRRISGFLFTLAMIFIMMLCMSVTVMADDNNYLTFEGTAPFTIEFEDMTGIPWNGILEYSTDKTNWKEWGGENIQSSADSFLYLRGRGNDHITGDAYKNGWVIDAEGTVSCKGDIRTLLDYENPDNTEMDHYCFANLFCDCACLVKAPELPATDLSVGCYYSMFSNCDLSDTPTLSANTLKDECYAYMFSNNDNISEVRSLPALELADNCYYCMFESCSGLIKAPKLPAVKLANSC